MDFFNDIFNIPEQEKQQINMSKDEFVQKTKDFLNYISSKYCNNWKSRRLKDEEYPEESICDVCTGCGIFKMNGEEAECVADRIEGECYVRYFDAEEFGLEIEEKLDDMYKLLEVDNIE